MSALLEIQSLSVSYGEARALHEVGFSVEPGRALAVLGANGSGKSSLAAAIAGVVRARSGRIVLDGRDITTWSPHRISRAGIAYVPEGRGIFPHLSVIDNLRAMLRYAVPRHERAATLRRAVELFPILGERASQSAGTLSGGEQQMLALARVLAAPPRLLVADEMSLGLAPRMVDTVFDGLRRAREASRARSRLSSETRMPRFTASMRMVDWVRFVRSTLAGSASGGSSASIVASAYGMAARFDCRVRSSRVQRNSVDSKRLE